MTETSDYETRKDSLLIRQLGIQQAKLRCDSKNVKCYAQDERSPKLHALNITHKKKKRLSMCNGKVTATKFPCSKLADMLKSATV